MKFTKLIISCLMAIAPLSALPWGQKGHDTVACIAENHLTPATRNALDSILGGKSIIYYANWLDNASHTPEYQYSKTWHYKNVDAGYTYDSAPKHQAGDVVTALNREIRILCDTTQTAAERELAVKMIVHFLGDMHQPMHLGHLSDLGGNRWNVKIFGKDTNLHKLWDNSVPELAHKWSYTEWQQQIDRLPEEQQREIIKGDPDSWAAETFDICTKVYEATPKGFNASYDYIAEWTPVVERQFLRGGLRLADILNSIFDPEYTPVSKAVIR